MAVHMQAIVAAMDASHVGEGIDRRTGQCWGWEQCDWCWAWENDMYILDGIGAPLCGQVPTARD